MLKTIPSKQSHKDQKTKPEVALPTYGAEHGVLQNYYFKFTGFSANDVTNKQNYVIDYAIYNPTFVM